MTTDLQLRQQVLLALDQDPRFDSGLVGVAVKEGVVALTGEVLTQSDRQAIEAAVRAVPGVHALASNLVALDVPTAPPSDMLLAVHILRALNDSLIVRLDGIQITVTKGWVTIAGYVPHWLQREAIERALRAVPGVRGLENDVHVHVRNPMLLKTRVEEALQDAASIDISGIDVEARGGTVILKGCVRSAAERSDAEFAVWNVPGVRHVTDTLRVTEPSETP
jgi:osmotically-inducible protein OsmY